MTVSPQKILFSAFVVLLFAFPEHASAQKLPQNDSLIIEKILSYANHFKANGNISESAQYLEKAAFTYWKNNNTVQSKKYYTEACDIYKADGKEKAYASVCTNLAQIEADSKHYPEALEYLSKAETIYKKLGFDGFLSDIYKDQAVVHKNQKNYTNGIQSVLLALKLSEKLNDSESTKECYALLAELYKLKGDNAQSLVYYNKFQDADGRTTSRNESKYTTVTDEHDGSGSPDEHAYETTETDNSQNALAYMRKQNKKGANISVSEDSTAMHAAADSLTQDLTTEQTEPENPHRKQNNAIIFAIGFILTIAWLTFFMSRRKHSRRNLSNTKLSDSSNHIKKTASK